MCLDDQLAANKSTEAKFGSLTDFKEMNNTDIFAAANIMEVIYSSELNS
jgi:hypothetical protein